MVQAGPAPGKHWDPSASLRTARSASTQSSLAGAAEEKAAVAPPKKPTQTQLTWPRAGPTGIQRCWNSSTHPSCCSRPRDAWKTGCTSWRRPTPPCTDGAQQHPPQSAQRQNLSNTAREPKTDMVMARSARSTSPCWAKGLGFSERWFSRHKCLQTLPGITRSGSDQLLWDPTLAQSPPLGNPI